MKISMCQAIGGVSGPLKDFYADYFREQGHVVEPLPQQGSMAAIGDLLFSINFVPDIAKLAKALKKPYVAWLSDAWLNPRLNDKDCVSDYSILLHFSRNDLEKSQRLGYRHAYFLPRPIDIAPFLKASEAGGERGYPLVFVGNCYLEEQSEYRLFKRQYLAQNIPPEYGLNTLESYLAQTQFDLVTPAHTLFSAWIQAHDPDFLKRVPLPDSTIARDLNDGFLAWMVDHLLGHEMDWRARQTLVRSLAPLGVHVWGDEKGWAPCVPDGIHYHGSTRSAGESASVLCQARICVNMARRFSDGVIFRTYEAPASGGLQLAIHHPDVAAMFEEDQEIVFFRTFDEARDKAAFYLKHDEARERIAQAGRARVARDHTIRNRYQEIQTRLSSLGISL